MEFKKAIAYSCSISAKKRFTTSIEYYKNIAYLQERFIQVSKFIDEKLNFYPENMVFKSYRFQQISANASPEDYGLKKNGKFILKDVDNLRFWDIINEKYLEGISFGTITEINDNVELVESDDEECESRDNVEIKVRQHIDSLVDLRKAEHVHAKNKTECPTEYKLKFEETSSNLHCMKATPDDRVYRMMETLYQHNILIVNMHIMRKYLPWIKKQHLLPEHTIPTITKIMPGWYILTSKINQSSYNKILYYVYTLYPKEFTKKLLKTFTTDRVHPFLNPELQNLRIKIYIEKVLQNILKSRNS